VELAGHPLWTVFLAVGAVVAVGLQLSMLRKSGMRSTWITMIPVLLAATVGGGLTHRLENLNPWRVAADCSVQRDHQKSGG
jgi:hypothetical protein